MCVCLCVCMHTCSVTQLCLTLCNAMDCSPPGSSAHGFFRARILEQAAFPTPGDLPKPGIKPTSLAFPAFTGGFLYTLLKEQKRGGLFYL